MKFSKKLRSEGQCGVLGVQKGTVEVSAAFVFVYIEVTMSWQGNQLHARNVDGA